MNIKEYIRESDIDVFISENYSLHVLERHAMEGYEDYNIKVRALTKNGNTAESNDKLYVFKISHFSTEHHTLEFQNQMLLHLAKHGIRAPVPQKTCCGKYTKLFPSLGDKKVYARLLDYIEGVTFEESGKPIYVLHSIGTLVGKICDVLKSFRFENYKHRPTLFDLNRASELEEFVNKYLHGETSEMARQILKQYSIKIHPNLEKLQQGFIAGDVCSRNIILKRSENRNTSDNYAIAGIIDLGDAAKSVYLLEIAVVMADLMSVCYNLLSPLIVGKRLLAGIREHFEMTDLELSLLKLCIAIRLLQLHLVIEDMKKKDPKNSEYFEKCRWNCLEVCKYLWGISDDTFTDIVIN